MNCSELNGKNGRETDKIMYIDKITCVVEPRVIFLDYVFTQLKSYSSWCETFLCSCVRTVPSQCYTFFFLYFHVASLSPQNVSIICIYMSETVFLYVVFLDMFIKAAIKHQCSNCCCSGCKSPCFLLFTYLDVKHRIP